MKKIDLKSRMNALAASAEAEAADRFARAERVVERAPNALAPIRAEARGSSNSDTSLGGYEIGKTYDIPVPLIDPNPYSPRHFYRSALVDKTAMSMEENGQKVAVNGYVKADGRIGLYEGGTRLRAARAGGQGTLRVFIEKPPENDLELYTRAVEFHDERTNHTALDTAMLMNKLIADGVCKTQDELTQKIKVNGVNPSKQVVSMYMRIAKLIPQRLLLTMADHEITSNFGVAYEISAIFADQAGEADLDRRTEIADDVIRETVAKELNVRDVKALVAARLQGPKQRQRSSAISVKFGEAKGVIKLFERRGQLDFSIKGLAEDKLVQLKDALEDICAGRISIGEQR